MKHIPNAITCCNLISGCIAITFALQAHYDMALLFIIIGAVFDFFDGMTARLLHVSSPIGKELDSLADVVTFGVAPATMLYQTLSTLHPTATALPPAAFLLSAFSALRLAKFNLDQRQTTSFIGLPTPANALLWASLLTYAPTHWQSTPAYTYILLALAALSCLLLVAEFPMFALKFKTWGWHGNAVKYTFIATSALLLVAFRGIGIALVIVWYIVLSAALLAARPHHS